MQSQNEPPFTKNSLKIDKAQISLDFLKKEVGKLTKQQTEIRLMLLEILEQTRPYVLQEKEEEEEEPAETPQPARYSWWS